MQKEMKLIDFKEVYELSEARAVPILRILYDEYIPKRTYTSNLNPSIMYVKKKRAFEISY